MDREHFMDFFRNDEKLEQLTPDDRIEIFLSGDGGKPYAQMGRRPISPDDGRAYSVCANVILLSETSC